MRTLFSFLGILFLVTTISAQDDMESLANGLLEEQTEYALGSFYSSRIVSGHSVFLMPKRGLDFRVHHRFGQFNSGFNNFYGMDQSSSFLSLEYGLSDRINIGLGRATYRDIFNSYLKIALWRQQKGKRIIPISIVYAGFCAAQSTQYNDAKRNNDFNARLAYTHQLLIARMFSPSLTIQLAPTFVHRNLVPVGEYFNNIYALGLGGRYKITNTISVNAEWYYLMNRDKPVGSNIYDPLSFGVDIQVAGHVFQIHLTNAEAMTENAFLTETNTRFFQGDIRPGFNISQVFTF